MAPRITVLAVFCAACLLPQARADHEPQVVLEVRLASVSDTFFERIGVNFNVNTSTDKQGPQGPLEALAAANREQHVDQALGAAFLSDLQVFQFMEALHGDRRCSVMQFPRLTVQSKQTGSLDLTETRHFLTGVEWVSVDGQHLLRPKNEPVKIGFQMKATPAVSADRRFVQVALNIQQTEMGSAPVPLIPVQIPVPSMKNKSEKGNEPVVAQMFLQQPQLSTWAIENVLTIPVGQTVVIGGSKTTTETRSESGPPVLSKIPYANRLFRNVGYGRETQTQLILVTPRILGAAVKDQPAAVSEPAPHGKTIRVHNALASDLAPAITEFIQKKMDGRKTEEQVVVAAEPVSNTLLVSAGPETVAEIARLVAHMDVAPKQYLIQVAVYEGEPRDAREKAKLLSRPEIVTVENQVAKVHIGQEVEIPVGGDQKRKVNAGVLLEVVVGRAHDNQVPVRLVTEIATVSEQEKDRATHNIQRTEHTANYPPGKRILSRGGRTSSGKELWIEATVTEITSREQLLEMNRNRRNEE